jgi:Domain of unknown function (DUF6285)
MQDRPTAAELVAAIRAFLEEDVMPAVEGRVAFHTRVAVNALGMVERELVLGPELEVEERARATALLGHPGDAYTLERELADAIRAGAVAADDPRVVQHVRATVRDKLRIANPKYVR